MTTTIIKRNKEKTKQKLIKAVGKILRKDGFQAIKINKVAETAGVGKKLIYDYFESLDGLIKAYLNQVDFWKQEQAVFDEDTMDFFGHSPNEALFELLKNNFEYLEKSVEMQKIILWGISEKNKSMQNLIEEREEFGENIFKLMAKPLKGSDVDFRAVNAILVSAIYYMTLHAKTNGVTVCGIDLARKEGKERIFNTMKLFINFCCQTRK
ncbi:TetR/AcrR family transcriptional regulator [Niabella sp.]|uniref:TetR/AcrR family transcriptional regulator n=1 Tax=Niabella sp. TaxID=1962976 RepID=UPI00263650D4|nr:TetR/AcrR family transcriptional regulator [Niabella sp.]